MDGGVFNELLSRDMTAGMLNAGEMRAQAAQIRGHVESLDNPVARAYLIALYLPKPGLERQPGKKIECVDYFAEDRHKNIVLVANWLIAQQGTGVHHTRHFVDIVAEWTLGGMTILHLKRFPSVRRLVAAMAKITGEKRDQCRVQLAELDVRAHALIDDRLYSTGLFLEAEAA